MRPTRHRLPSTAPASPQSPPFLIPAPQPPCIYAPARYGISPALVRTTQSISTLDARTHTCALPPHAETLPPHANALAMQRLRSAVWQCKCKCTAPHRTRPDAPPYLPETKGSRMCNGPPFPPAVIEGLAQGGAGNDVCGFDFTWGPEMREPWGVHAPALG